MICIKLFIKLLLCLLADTRDIDEKRRNTVIENIHKSATTIANNRRVKLSEFKIINQDPPALSDKLIIEASEAASKELNLTYKKMISRAYHDSLFMARYENRKFMATFMMECHLFCACKGKAKEIYKLMIYVLKAVQNC